MSNNNTLSVEQSKVLILIGSVPTGLALDTLQNHCVKNEKMTDRQVTESIEYLQKSNLINVEKKTFQMVIKERNYVDAKVIVTIFLEVTSLGHQALQTRIP